MDKKYIEVKDLQVYQLALQISDIAWDMYQKLDWRTKKIIGDQFIESADSVGANIVEGYSRYHYLDKIKFYYNSRASLQECCVHWLELLLKKKLVKLEQAEQIKVIHKQLGFKLNNFIKTTYLSKQALNF